MWDELTYPFPNFKGASVEVWECINNFTGNSTVYPTVCLGAHKKHKSSASLAIVRGINRWPVDSPYNGPVTRKMFPFDDVIMWNFVSVFSRKMLSLTIGNRSPVPQYFVITDACRVLRVCSTNFHVFVYTVIQACHISQSGPRELIDLTTS